MGGIIVKAIVWIIWLSKNVCIFSVISSSSQSVISKMAHVLISWFSAAPVSQHVKFEEHISTIRHSLAFYGPYDDSTSEEASGDRTSDQGLG